MILKTVLMPMMLIFMACGGPAWALTGNDAIAIMTPTRAQEKREQQRSDREKADRDQAETRAQDASREAAYKESRAAHKAKVNKMRKDAGLKPHNSWQLNH